MKRADEVRAEHKLDTITHYLLKAFPGGGIRSSGMSGGDYVLTVCFLTVDRTFTLYIPKVFLRDPRPAIDEIPRLFDELELPRVLAHRGHYSLASIPLPVMTDKTSDL
jgi:hypothetical protein